MILTLGSSICAASQSVETSGSSVENVMVRISGVSQSSLPDLIRLDPAIHLLETMDTRVKPACDEVYPFGFFGSYFSTGPPASRQAAKPPPIWATGFSPMSCAVLAASAERKPPAQ